MTGQASADQAAAAPRRVPGWVHALCLIWAVFVIVENVQNVLWYLPVQTAFTGGTIGSHISDIVGNGFIRLKVEPGGPLAKAGVATGDAARFDRRYDFTRHLWPGEQVGLTLIHGNRSRHITVAAAPRQAPASTASNWLGTLYGVATAIGALFGLFIVLRSRRHLTTWLLGSALLTYGLIDTTPQLWVSGPDTYALAYALCSINLVAISIQFYAFAVSFSRDWVGPGKPYERIVFGTYVVVVAVLWILDYGVTDLLLVRLMPQDWVTWIGLVCLNFGYVACLVYLGLGWRRSTAAVQQRYALMLVATVAIVLAQAFDVYDPENGALLIAHYVTNIILTLGIAYPLFTYAILRQKVFDLGFAVNRTLVYSVVSAVLLASFGLVEWAVDHFAPVQGRGKNALIDAAVAVGIFLTFHRVRAVVEHGIEGLFFRRWQEAEARLRRFVRESAFVRSADVLAHSFAAALSRFADDAPAAVYLADGDGQPRKAASARDIGPAALDVDDPALVALRAEPRPVEPDQVGSKIPAALIVPMVNRNEVVGVVVLGWKESGLSYRPDETDLIDWATHQVGLDLYALKVEQLERERSELRVELRSANTQIERLLELKGARA